MAELARGKIKDMIKRSYLFPIAAEAAAWATASRTASAGRLKTWRAHQLVDTKLSMIGFNLNNGARWIGVRKAQDPARRFVLGVDTTWVAFRKVVPLVGDAPGGLPENQSAGEIMAFIKGARATNFFAGPAMPPGESVALVRW